MFETEISEHLVNKIFGRFRLSMLRFTHSIRMMYRYFHRKPFCLRDVFVSVLIIAVVSILANIPAFGQGDENGEDLVAVFNQAQDLHEKGDLAAAIKLYEKALKIEPAFPEAQYQIGTAQLALGKKGEAETAFRLAIDLRTDWTLPITALGSLLIDKGMTGEAERLLTKAVALEPQNPMALTGLTQIRINRKAPLAELEKLLVPITDLTTKVNATPDLWSARAALENALQKRAAAKTSILKALESDPKNRQAMFLLAEIAMSEGDIARAKDLAARIGAAAVTDDLRLLRANIFAFEGKADEALAQLDTIENPNPSAVDLRAKIATSKTTSATDLEKLLDAKPADAFILGRLCTVYRRENPDKALTYCRKASEAEPGNVNHAVGFGAALVQGKQYETAVGILRKIVEIVPDNFTAHANLATALFQLKRFPEAKAEFEWLAAAQPTSAGAYLFLGIIYDESGEYLDAMANYQLYLRFADPVDNKLDIEKVNLRLPPLQKLIKGKKK